MVVKLTLLSIHLTVIKRTEILLYRGNLNKAKFYIRMKKITLI